MDETSLHNHRLDACPFCGAGTSFLRENGKVWMGSRYGEPSSVSVLHHCEPTPGQPHRAIERIGRDMESAISAWNMRATPPLAAEPQHARHAGASQGPPTAATGAPGP